MAERFVDEPIEPVVATADTSLMAGGGPGLPHEFRWRGRTIEIAALLRSWRETGKCRHGSAELYVRKHWFEVVTTDHATMKIYFERQSRRGRKEPRWWLFTISEPD
jgi:phosphoribosylglycinamide formyltransferase-1